MIDVGLTFWKKALYVSYVVNADDAGIGIPSKK